ncbi:MAG TPA: PEFG-CTERM sorting domain-containing protein, partial [Nitrosopumilaceae archaeon]|nr:PEFG-CTERM sorting domain-containing protein [Nitrosopumilaceae archaeon]
QTSLDGTVLVTIQTTDATAGEYLGIDVIFKDSSEKQIPHVNYDLKVSQEGNDVLFLKSQHAEAGMVEHWTRPLFSDKPVDVEVTLLGMGLPKDRESWTGQSGETLSFYAVPEFGTLALAILIISILSVIALTKPLTRKL